jgi:hypothetical protein
MVVKIKVVKSLYCLIYLLTYCFIITSPIFADAWSPSVKDLGLPPAQAKDFEKLITNILNSATSLAIIAVFVMLLYGGFKYLTAGGDPKAMDSGKNTITYALIGLVLMFGAWFILRLITAFTGVEVGKFSIPLPS